MNGTLQQGTTLTSDSGVSYTVKKLLGSGGQGEVYEVTGNGKSHALKWYYPHTATASQKAVLENLVLKGAPDSVFLWPEDMVSDSSGGTFGYVMPLRPAHYKSIVDLMKRRAEPTFKALCRAAVNLCGGFEKLHGMGYAYRDISFGNLFFDPKNGDVLICDNDNVAPVTQEGDGSTVYGTPRFMAPEIVMGKGKPSRQSDQFSLAVLLFYMFMVNHPLEGKLEADIRCMDIFAMNKLFGSHPVFIFDPENESNRPVSGIHDNALIYWGLYPDSLKTLFVRAFTDGLREPHKRVTTREWKDLFANLYFSIAPCSCGAEVFHDGHFAVPCWHCKGTSPKMPLTLVSGRSRALLLGHSQLAVHHADGKHDIDTTIGKVVQNPNNPDLWGIQNVSQSAWTYIRPDGTHVPVAPGRTAAIAKGAQIDFGQQIGKIV